MNIFKDTKNAIVDRVKGYFTINNVSYHLNEQAVTTAFSSTYDAISVLSRCTDMIINTAAATELIIVEDTGILNKRTSFSKFEKLLANPDPTMSELQFRKMIYRDLFFSGNTFIYNLGNALQILSSVEYSDDNKPSSGGIALDEDRLTHVRLLNESGYQYGRSYLTRIDNEIKLITKMLNFQSNYFSNNGFPGVILETDHPLAKRSKERLAEEFVNMFSIQKGVSGKPFVLDNSIKMRDVQRSFKDLQFLESVNKLANNIMNSLGVPSVLINGGNNANIAPNQKLFIYLTVAYFVDIVASELTRHLHRFYPGTRKLKIIGNYDDLQILKDDFLKLSNSVKTLYSTGVLNKNEARLRLGYAAVEGGDEFLEPANITGNLFDGNATQEDDE